MHKNFIYFTTESHWLLLYYNLVKIAIQSNFSMKKNTCRLVGTKLKFELKLNRNKKSHRNFDRICLFQGFVALECTIGYCDFGIAEYFSCESFSLFSLCLV